MTSCAEFTWTGDMPVDEFVTRFMEIVVQDGERGRLQMDAVINGKPATIEISIELLGIGGLHWCMSLHLRAEDGSTFVYQAERLGIFMSTYTPRRGKPERWFSLQGDETKHRTLAG